MRQKGQQVVGQKGKKQRMVARVQCLTHHHHHCHGNHCDLGLFKGLFFTFTCISASFGPFHLFCVRHFFRQLHGNRWLSPTPYHPKTCHIWPVLSQSHSHPHTRSQIPDPVRIPISHPVPFWLALLISVFCFVWFFFRADNIILKPIKAKFMRTAFGQVQVGLLFRFWSAIIGSKWSGAR